VNDSGTIVKRVEETSAGPGKQRRSLATRQQLISAARTIFARDGFAETRLEDIAAEAGKTRGAFYAHFRDKEDVFLAIFEEDTRRDKQRLMSMLGAATTCEERVDVLARYMLGTLKDERRALLNLEFKAYAIRHPAREQRLDALVSTTSLICTELGVDQVVPELREDNFEVKKVHSAEFGALLDGLAINRLFSPKALDDARTLWILRAGVREILRHAVAGVAEPATEKPRKPHVKAVRTKSSSKTASRKVSRQSQK
jgi:AcrR family transcriptional regulator